MFDSRRADHKKKKKKLGNLDREKEKPNGLKEIYQRNYEATFVARKLPNSSKAIRLPTQLDIHREEKSPSASHTLNGHHHSKSL